MTEEEYKMIVEIVNKQAYSPTQIECLRFGGRLGGGGMGCCGVDIIQGFAVDPDAPATKALTSGDSLMPIKPDGKPVVIGGTNADIFRSYLRCGTFSQDGHADKTFLTVMTAVQLRSKHGEKWLALLKEEGFEFIRTFRNSVSGGGLHLFGLFRSGDGNGSTEPPVEWTNLPEPKKTPREIYNNRKMAYVKTVPETPDKVAKTAVAAQNPFGEKAAPTPVENVPPATTESV